MLDMFSRTRLILGDSALLKLSRSRVAVFGVGGVGGYVVEALARSGVGALDLTDGDIVSTTNLNRQILALHSTIGRDKVEVAKARILDINPECAVTARKMFFLPDSEGFDFSSYDYVVDAIDTVSSKLEIVRRAKEAGVKIISAMGAGNKLDPAAFEVSDIFKTSVCPLAKTMRRELRKMGVESLKVVYSKEEPTSRLLEAAEEGAGRRIPGSVAFVPAAMGLIIAGEVVKDLIAESGDNGV